MITARSRVDGARRRSPTSAGPAAPTRSIWWSSTWPTWPRSGTGPRELLDRYEQIHVLVNNAGLVLSGRTETKDGFESTLAINHLGPVPA